MRPRAILDPRAADELDAITAWYSQPGAGRRARAKLQRIRDAIRQIGQHPQMWPIGMLEGTRERVVADHVIVYRILEGDEDATAEILAIFGPGQDRSGPL